MEDLVRIVDGGLAGSEAAYQLARRGVTVELFEMRPSRTTEAHSTGYFGELVCSNSFRSNSLTAPAGVLKEEMRRLDSLIIRTAEVCRVPAGSALAVDREAFAAALTNAVEALPQARVIRREAEKIPPGLTILASGPLTSAALSNQLAALVGERHLYFYDAISPIVTAESVDAAVLFPFSRFGRGGGGHFNFSIG